MLSMNLCTHVSIELCFCDFFYSVVKVLVVFSPYNVHFIIKIPIKSATEFLSEKSECETYAIIRIIYSICNVCNEKKWNNFIVGHVMDISQ